VRGAEHGAVEREADHRATDHLADQLPKVTFVHDLLPDARPVAEDPFDDKQAVAGSRWRHAVHRTAKPADALPRWEIGPKVMDMNAPELRASDEDREQVVQALERHTAVGRLSLDEHADRVERTLTARTCGELAAILSDLPPEPAEPTPTTRAGDHQLAIALLIACVALALVGALVLLFR
jgi:hypothetical protein